MVAPLVVAGVAAGIGALGGLLGGKKELDIPDFSQFYRDYRSEFAPEGFGLSTKELASLKAEGLQGISEERDIGLARSNEALQRAGLGRSAAAATVGLTGAAAAEQNFGRFMLQLSAYAEQTSRAHEAQFFQQAAQAYGLNLSAEQLKLQAEQQGQDQFGSFLQSITDPIASYVLYKDIQKIDALQNKTWS